MAVTAAGINSKNNQKETPLNWIWHIDTAALSSSKFQNLLQHPYFWIANFRSITSLEHVYLPLLVKTKWPSWVRVKLVQAQLISSSHQYLFELYSENEFKFDWKSWDPYICSSSRRLFIAYNQKSYPHKDKSEE